MANIFSPKSLKRILIVLRQLLKLFYIFAKLNSYFLHYNRASFQVTTSIVLLLRIFFYLSQFYLARFRVAKGAIAAFESTTRKIYLAYKACLKGA